MSPIAQAPARPASSRATTAVMPRKNLPPFLVVAGLPAGSSSLALGFVRAPATGEGIGTFADCGFAGVADSAWVSPGTELLTERSIALRDFTTSLALLGRW